MCLKDLFADLEKPGSLALVELCVAAIGASYGASSGGGQAHASYMSGNRPPRVSSVERSISGKETTPKLKGPGFFKLKLVAAAGVVTVQAYVMLSSVSLGAGLKTRPTAPNAAPPTPLGRGRPSSTLYIVRAGRVETSYEGGQRLVGAGASFGELCVLGLSTVSLVDAACVTQSDFFFIRIPPLSRCY